MPLLLAFRRYWAIAFIAILSVFTIGFVLPDLPAPLRTTVAPAERWWEHAGERLDPYINNTFAFRGAVLAAHRTYGRWLGGGPGELVLKGERGALFIKDEHAVEQSIGQLVRPQVVTQAADVATLLDRYMKSIGGRFVMLVPPNAQTNNFDLLPAYARALAKKPTEYDLLDAEMKKRGIPFVDMRPILAEARKSGPIHWLADTHWNQRSALIGFNAAMTAAGRPDLTFDPAEALNPPSQRRTGDLVRLSGELEAAVPDVEYLPKPMIQLRKDLTPIPDVMKPVPASEPFPPVANATGREGPRIMVIGDSFTQNPWSGPLSQVASAYAWMHHRYCRFDLGAVERFRPDILIYAPSERQIPCKGEPQR